MVGIIFILIFLCAGIVLLGGYSPFKKQTREQFLQSLAKFLEGDLRPIETEPDGFRIGFDFEGQIFSYEDIPEHGFTENVYKGYLKAQSPTKLTLGSTEKPRSATIKFDVIIASKIQDEPVQGLARVRVPPKLKDLNIHASDPNLVNALWDDPKIVSIFSGFKNVDARGYPSMSIKMMDGLVILEFSPRTDKKPNRPNLMRDIHAMDEYLAEFLKIIKKLKEVSI
jgi:hypothetical protein